MGMELNWRSRELSLSLVMRLWLQACLIHPLGFFLSLNEFKVTKVAAYCALCYPADSLLSFLKIISFPF